MTRKCVQMTRKELLLFIIQVYLNVLSCSKNGFLKKGEIGHHLYQFNAQFSFRRKILYKEIFMLHQSFIYVILVAYFFVIQRPFVKVHHIYSLRPIAFILEFGTEFLKGVKLFNYCQKTTTKIPQSANSFFCDRKTSKADENRKRQVGWYLHREKDKQWLECWIGSMQGFSWRSPLSKSVRNFVVCSDQ